MINASHPHPVGNRDESMTEGIGATNTLSMKKIFGNDHAETTRHIPPRKSDTNMLGHHIQFLTRAWIPVRLDVKTFQGQSALGKERSQMGGETFSAPGPATVSCHRACIAISLPSMINTSSAILNRICQRQTVSL